MQNELENVEDDKTKWVKDEREQEDEAEVVKLDVGESIAGLLVDKYRSTKYNAGIYKIKVKGDGRMKIIIGTTILDKLMEPKEINEEVKITRLEDGKSQKGRSYQNWETFHLHRSSSK